MKRVVSVLLVLLIVLVCLASTPADAGGKDLLIGGALLGGGFLLGSILGPHDRIIVGPVYRAYSPPVYYQPPVYYYSSPSAYPYPSTARWIPDHYELRWQTVCEFIYQYQHCYPVQITVFIPGHWEY